MPLTDEQELKVAKWFSSHNVNKNCPACGKNDWEIPTVVSLGFYLSLGSILSLDLPALSQVCRSCAYIRLFSWDLVNS